MTKNLILILGALIGLSACSNPKKNKIESTNTFSYQNPISSGIDPNGLRDCQVLRDGDWWYMTGTSYPHWLRQEKDGNLNKGVALYKSKDLLNWEFVDYIVKQGGPDKWYYRRFWAPEIQKIGGKYYALFNARNDEMGYKGQHPGYAVADQIEGPYTMVTEDKPLCNGNDLTFFEDDDQKVYAFWNRGREFGIGFAQIDLETATFLSEPTSAIQPAQVDYEKDDTGEIVMEANYDGTALRPKVAKYYDWDAIGIEGAYVIKEKDKYYLFYSSWTRGYEIGYATADQITGPWTKYEKNPFYGAQSKATCEKNGLDFTGDPNTPFVAVGHNEIFTGPDGRRWLSCHGIVEGQQPMLVIDPIWFDKQGNVQSDGPTYTEQSIEW
ncbi:glycoside hydrolase family 43 protein [Reichenbachiella ulvae]|uniref:Family 43 glycosylhydrolase n=1 Tax=Reichenbachiella ulvae TaxID=2980104 RepID=A0ABT3D037_9BACT|nr:family 43 glycosylhydrolase [Reichenbachiella ulvae]MCV9389300.1 family 43 glycosylhydrolase [Reichenbachiella ulvae]